MESHTKSAFAENYLFETSDNILQKTQISKGYACYIKNPTVRLSCGATTKTTRVRAGLSYSHTGTSE